MQLIRNTTEDGTCKYALIRLDKIREAGLMNELERVLGEFMHKLPGNEGAALRDFVEFGLPNTEEEFFAIKLKDINAKDALEAYGVSAAHNGDSQLGAEVVELANRSGVDSPWCKQPD